MNIDEVKLLFDFNYWADKRIADTAARVSPEQYAAPTDFGLGFPSLRGTILHILDGEWGWRLRLERATRARPAGDPADEADLTEAQLPTLSALRERWSQEETALRKWVNGLRDEELNGLVRYPLPSGGVRERVLWHSLVHLINHGTQHRSEAAALLTHYGQSPGEMDFNVFLNEHFHLPQA